MSEVKRYWVPNGTLSDQSGWHQDDHEVVQACAYDAALAREAALREELASANSDKEAYAQNAIDLQEQRDSVREELALIIKSFDDLAASVGFSEARLDQTGDSPIDCANQLQQRLTDAEKKLGEAYEWGYSDGQNCPNGYSDEKDRDKCVAELTKPAAEPEALGTRPVGCCCPPKGHTGIWAAAMCPVHFGLRMPRPSAEGEGS